MLHFIWVLTVCQSTPLGVISIQSSPLDKSACVINIYFLISETKTYVVDTQKNHINETVLLSYQNICF